MPSREVGPITQDWELIFIHKHKQKHREKGQGKKSGVNAIIRAGTQVKRIKKFDGGQNKGSKLPSPLNVIKINAEMEASSLGKVCVNVQYTIQKSLIKLTQVEVAKAINERAQVV
eukprot:Gb_01731 [translate_table: standard]